MIQAAGCKKTLRLENMCLRSIKTIPNHCNNLKNWTLRFQNIILISECNTFYHISPSCLEKTTRMAFNVSLCLSKVLGI